MPLTFANSAVGRRAAASWARAVPITSCGRASVRCSCRGARAHEDVTTAAAADRRARSAATATTTSAYYNVLRSRPARRQLRDSNPSVVVIPGLGVYGFGKDKREARITTEFFVERRPRDGRRDGARGRRQRRSCASAGAHGGAGEGVQELPQLRRAAEERSVSHRVLGARGGQAAADAGRSASSAGRSRWSSAGGSGIGREVALLLAQLGAHVVVADRDEALAPVRRGRTRRSCRRQNWGWPAPVDLSSRGSIAAALRARFCAFGGVDIVINTAAIYPTPDPSRTDVEADLGEHAAHQRHRQLRAGRRGGAGATRAESAGDDGVHELGERDRAQERQRGLRRQQGRREPP